MDCVHGSLRDTRMAQREREEVMEGKYKKDSGVNCSCALWKNNLPKINAFIVMGNTHGMQYDGASFVYCPWCGKKCKGAA